MSHRWLLAVAGIISLFYIAMAAQFLDRLQPLTGDEPYYVMTAISMVHDRDLNEANNYANRDYDEFYPPDPLPANWDGWPAFPRTLPPHPATTDLDGIHTKHGLGLTLLIAIPYELAGRAGAVLVVLICAMLVAVNMYLLARDATEQPVWAAAIAVMLAVSMPIAPYAALLFPEIPAALLLIYAIRRLAAPANSRLTWVLTAAAIGYLPWLHQRFVPTVVVLVCVVLLRLSKARDVSLAVVTLAPIAVAGFGLVGYNLWLYGGPLQDTADHAGFNGVGDSINAGFGLLLDAQWGLLVAAPVYLLALAGFPLWYRASPVARLALLALFPYVIVLATYRVWWGEWGPPARYLVPIAPFAAGPLALMGSRLARSGRVAVAGLWGVGMALTLVGLANPQRFYHQPNGLNNLYARVDEALSTNVAERLVAFQPLAQSPLNQRIGVSAALLVLLAIAILGLVVSQRNAPPSRERQNQPVD